MRGPPKSTGDEELIEDVCRRLEPHLGKPAWVYHDKINEWVHVDVHIVAPSEAAPRVTLFTTGMSERFMTVPLATPPHARTAELVMTLPKEWPHDVKSIDDPKAFWPVAWLRFFARYPFKQRTWLGPHHTVPGMIDPTWEDPPTKFDAALLLPTSRLKAEDSIFPRRGSKEKTAVLAVCPIFEAERAFAEKSTAAALLERFRERAIDPEIVDPKRAPVV